MGNLNSHFLSFSKKLKEIGVESKDYGYDEDFEQNMKDLSRDMVDPLNLKKNLNEPSYQKSASKESPVRSSDHKSGSEDEDYGVNDEEIQWEGESSQTPDYHDKERNYFDKSLKHDLHQFEPIKPLQIDVATNIVVPVKSPITSPKSPQELRQLFYDKFGKGGMDNKFKQDEVVSPVDMDDTKHDKVERVCEEVLNSLILELHSGKIKKILTDF